MTHLCYIYLLKHTQLFLSYLLFTLWNKQQRRQSQLNDYLVVTRVSTLDSAKVLYLVDYILPVTNSVPYLAFPLLDPELQCSIRS